MPGPECFSRYLCHVALLTAGGLMPAYAGVQGQSEKTSQSQKTPLTTVTAATPTAAPTESIAAKMLKARGIDPALLKALDNTTQFPPGENLIDINVNGEFKGSFTVIFNQDGGLCFTPELFSQLGLKLPDSASVSDTSCFDWAQQNPAVSIKFDTQSLTASIVVPEQALALSPTQITAEEGGIGALLNYSYFSSVSRNRRKQNNYNYLTLEDGFNINSWMVRSWQQLNQSEGKVSGELNSLYAERTFARWQKRFQFGQVGVSNTLFELGDIVGVQLIPDDGFQQDDAGGGVVEGIANTPQARVEVYQYGMLIYNTLVPAGPFRLSHIPLKNLNSDLDVKILETDGQQQQFTVPAAEIINVNPQGNEGLSLAAGKLRNVSEREGIPVILTMNQNWRSSSRLTAQSGILLSKKYQSVGASVGSQVLQGIQLAAQIIAASDTYHHRRSAQLSLSGSYSFSQVFSVSASVSKNTPGFYSINETNVSAADDYSQNDTQYTLSANWSTPKLGAFNLSHSESTQFDKNSAVSRYDTVGWSYNVKKMVLSVSISRSIGTYKNHQLSVNMNFPLGRQHINNYYRSTGAHSRLGSQLGGPLGSIGSYNLSAERDMQQREQSVQGGLNVPLHYTNVALAAGRSGPHSSNYSLSGSGGIAMVGSHVLFSPTAVGQTFGIITLNEPLPNVAISTPGGISWTDKRGVALAPQLPAWRPAVFDLDTETLPKKSDISNGHRAVTLGRGAVKRINYTVLSSRRVLLTLHLSDGTLLPRGSKVMDNKENLLTMALDDGTVYLNNSAEKEQLLIDIAGKNQRCSFSYQLDSEEDDGPYQRISGICI